MNIFKVITGNIVKWWQLTVMPILRIDNNQPKRKAKKQAANQSMAVSVDEAQSQINIQPDEERKQGPSDTDSVSPVPEVSDAQAVMDRINRERDATRLQALEEARLKAEEEARLASIMNANKVDVDAFIQAGKAAIQEKEQEAASPSNEDKDAMARAQEIMDRLNREAAEDEAKKQAEIDEARKQAKEKFGS